MTGTKVSQEKKGHPKGLYLLFVTEMAERFSYYGMRGIFILYLYNAFYTKSMSSEIYGSYTGLVYLTPLLGGFIADRYWGNRRSIIFGAILMGIGHFLMFGSACFVKQSIFAQDGPIDKNVNNSFSLILVFLGLFMLIMGNGFFKPNISTMVGDLYEPNDSRKDPAFTIFYMGINLGAFIYSTTIALPLFIITDKGLNRVERSRIGVIYIIAVFVIFFWSAYEQAGSSLTIIADTQVDKFIGSWEMPTTWFQSINPIAIVVLAPVMAYLWQFLNKFKLEPSSPVKQAIGLLLLSIGYVIFAATTRGMKETDKISMWWLVLLYVIHTLGELCLSPIGLSMVTKLSPPRLSSLLMGVWFMSTAASNVFAGRLSALLPERPGDVKNFIGFKISTLSQFLTIFVIMSGVASIILFAFCPLLKRMMKNVN